MPSKRFVFLGGAGFIGYHLAKAFSEIPAHKVLVIDNLVRGSMDQMFEDLCSKENVTFVNSDICDLQNLLSILDSDDIVFNLAALNGTQNFYKSPMQVIWNTANSAVVASRACVEKKVLKYIYFGSSESYAGSVQMGITEIPTPEDVAFAFPDSRNLRWSYGMSKALGEVACWAMNHESGIDFTIIRVHNIYGPRMGLEHVVPDLITKFLAGDMTVYGLNETRSFMFIDDFVKVVTQLYLNSTLNNCVVNVGTDEEISIRHLSTLIADLLGINEPVIDGGHVSGSVYRRCPDLSLLKENIALIPTSLEEGLQQTINYCLEFPPGRMPHRFLNVNKDSESN